MLQTLHVRDLALVRAAELRFAPGLNVVSGETGGGKSLLVTALKVLRGERVGGGLVRHGAAELRVDGEFAPGPGERSRAVAALLASLGDFALEEEGTLLVTRILDGSGRSKVRINDRPATLSALRALGPLLLEIHGQDESRALMRPEIQAETLDAFAGTRALRGRWSAALRAARELRERLDEATRGERERLARLEFLRFQVREMERLALARGELAALEREHRLLAHLDRLRELLATALDTLQDGEPSASDLLGRARRALEEAADVDAVLRDAAVAVAEAEIQAGEAARAVQSGSARLELDPGRLLEIEDRLAGVRGALQRFGPGEEDFFANLERARAELRAGEDEAEGPAALEARLHDSVGGLAKLGLELVRARQDAAPRMAAAMQRELAGLAMARTRVRVAMDAEVDPATVLERGSEHGPSPVDFEVCINPGEPFHSLRETASGGEMARVVLALKKCLADQDRVPFLAFDEIDAEIGGRLGLAVGRKLAEVARHHQVLIVTHLPQVAAFADAHFVVDKRSEGGRTVSHVRRLGAAEVERELAAMSVGEGADRAAITEARRLVARARGGEAS